jgi:predicted transcriptional regulator
MKATKYCTQLHPDLVKRLKQYALVSDVKDYEVVEDAVKEYLGKRQS